MPFDRSKYPPDWDDITKRIRAREGDRCKWCRVMNGTRILRSIDGKLFVTHKGQVCQASDGKFLGTIDMMPMPPTHEETIKIVLTVAHLDHDTTHNDPENLAALCQLHHLNHDRHHHAANRRRNRQAAKANRELFPGDVPPHVTVEQDLDRMEDEARRILADDPKNEHGLDLKQTAQRVRRGLA